jgi:hypothetical protein
LAANLVRVHIAGIDPRIYRLADELGLIIWVGSSSQRAATSAFPRLLARKNEPFRAPVI